MNTPTHTPRRSARRAQPAAAATPETTEGNGVGVPVLAEGQSRQVAVGSSNGGLKQNSRVGDDERSQGSMRLASAKGKGRERDMVGTGVGDEMKGDNLGDAMDVEELGSPSKRRRTEGSTAPSPLGTGTQPPTPTRSSSKGKGVDRRGMGIGRMQAARSPEKRSTGGRGTEHKQEDRPPPPPFALPLKPHPTPQNPPSFGARCDSGSDLSALRSQYRTQTPISLFKHPSTTSSGLTSISRGSLRSQTDTTPGGTKGNDSQSGEGDVFGRLGDTVAKIEPSDPNVSIGEHAASASQPSNTNGMPQSSNIPPHMSPNPTAPPRHPNPPPQHYQHTSYPGTFPQAASPTQPLRNQIHHLSMSNATLVSRAGQSVNAKFGLPPEVQQVLDARAADGKGKGREDGEGVAGLAGEGKDEEKEEDGGTANDSATRMFAAGDVIFVNHARGYKTTTDDQLTNGYFAIVRYIARCKHGEVYEMHPCTRSVISLEELGLPLDMRSWVLADDRIAGVLMEEGKAVEIFINDVAKAPVAGKIELAGSGASPNLEAEYKRNVDLQNEYLGRSESSGKAIICPALGNGRFQYLKKVEGEGVWTAGSNHVMISPLICDFSDVVISLATTKQYKAFAHVANEGLRAIKEFNELNSHMDVKPANIGVMKAFGDEDDFEQWEVVLIDTEGAVKIETPISTTKLEFIVTFQFCSKPIIYAYLLNKLAPFAPPEGLKMGPAERLYVEKYARIKAILESTQMEKVTSYMDLWSYGIGFAMILAPVYFKRFYPLDHLIREILKVMKNESFGEVLGYLESLVEKLRYFFSWVGDKHEYRRYIVDPEIVEATRDVLDECLRRAETVGPEGLADKDPWGRPYVYDATVTFEEAMQSQPIAKFSTAAVPTPSKRGRRSNASKQKGAIKFRTIARSGNIDPDGPPPPSVLSMHRPHIGEPQIFHSVFKIRDIPAELRKRSLESKAKTQVLALNGKHDRQQRCIYYIRPEKPDFRDCLIKTDGGYIVGLECGYESLEKKRCTKVLWDEIGLNKHLAEHDREEGAEEGTTWNVSKAT